MGGGWVVGYVEVLKGCVGRGVEGGVRVVYLMRNTECLVGIASSFIRRNVVVFHGGWIGDVSRRA